MPLNRSGDLSKPNVPEQPFNKKRDMALRLKIPLAHLLCVLTAMAQAGLHRYACSPEFLLFA